MRVLAHDPYADEPSPVRANLESDFTYLKLNYLPATVDFVPNGKVAVYDQAYGTEIGQVADGQKLILTGKIMDDNGVDLVRGRRSRLHQRFLLKTGRRLRRRR